MIFIATGCRLSHFQSLPIWLTDPYDARGPQVLCLPMVPVAVAEWNLGWLGAKVVVEGCWLGTLQCYGHLWEVKQKQASFYLDKADILVAGRHRGGSADADVLHSSSLGLRQY